MKILEELWNEKIRPADVKINTKQYSRFRDLAVENEKSLLEKLSVGEKEIFHKYVEICAEITDMEQYEIFRSGFCLGARIMLEVMDVPSVDY